MKKTTPKLAIDGGPKTFTTPPPPRGLLTNAEKKAVMALFDEAIAAGRAIGYAGPQEDGYCREFARSMGGGYADAVNSGTTALYVALRALEPPPFSEVIVPPITDPGGVMPVALCNCIPIVADSAPGTYNVGADQIAARITPRTSAIIVAHIVGEPADLAPILALARAKRIPVIEDVAQAHLAVYRGKPCGAHGTLGTFSTMFGKHHCTGGQGGVVFTKSRDLYIKVRHYADRGKPYGLTGWQPGNVVASLNFNLDEIGACIGRVQLRRLPSMVRRRRALVAAIRRGTARLKAVHPVEPVRGAEPSWWFLRVRLDLSRLAVGKDRFCEALKAEGPIAVTPSYRHIPLEAPWFKERRVFGNSGLPWTAPQYKGDPDRKYETPNAIAAVESCINLDIHESMRPADGVRIARALAKVEAAYLKR
jgi:dTDP-4-amino-4,6-dideoxygalactose transaminase